ncbi:MAG TPA: nuclear transport factor 2 family protein [Gemmatimonadales bacterium]|jgi:hypothetical protein|nr:nuclear transport factor 2 family protein [Gemmatimonadales bacterium]
MRVIRAAGLVAGLLVLTVPVLHAQAPDDRLEVLAVIRRLFDAMRAGDSAMVRSVFHPKARLASALIRQGVPVVQVEDDLEGFVRAVGTPHAEVWDERTRHEQVLLDGTLAVVWAEYTFYLGDKFSHCGVDAFQLAKGPAGWQIVALADTRRRDGCPSS